MVQQPSFNSKTSPFSIPLNLNFFLIIFGFVSSTNQLYSIEFTSSLLDSFLNKSLDIDLLLDKQSLSNVLNAILD
jgi:hypothetical protein